MYDITNYIEAKTVLEASEALLSNEGSKIICGGTDVLIKAREGKSGYVGVALVGVTRIPELRTITMEADGTIVIGAAVTFTEIENSDIIKKHLNLVGRACGTVGGPQVRNQGTMGGNICNGATSADSATSMVVSNATLVIQKKETRREVKISDFYAGPGTVNL